MTARDDTCCECECSHAVFSQQILPCYAYNLPCYAYNPRRPVSQHVRNVKPQYSPSTHTQMV
jgi:hypothetical protein